MEKMKKGITVFPGDFFKNLVILIQFWYFLGLIFYIMTVL